MIIPESPPQRRPKPIAATCARQQHENNQVTTQSSQKTQSADGSYGRRGGSGHIRSQASLRGGHTTVLPMRRGRVTRQLRRASAKARRAKDARQRMCGQPQTLCLRLHLDQRLVDAMSREDGLTASPDPFTGIPAGARDDLGEERAAPKGSARGGRVRGRRRPRRVPLRSWAGYEAFRPGGTSQ